MMVQHNFLIEERDLKELRKVAEAQDLTVSQLMRKLVRDYLAKQKNKKS